MFVRTVEVLWIHRRNRHGGLGNTIFLSVLHDLDNKMVIWLRNSVPMVPYDYRHKYHHVHISFLVGKG